MALDQGARQLAYLRQSFKVGMERLEEEDEDD